MSQSFVVGDYVRIRTYCFFALQAQLSINDLTYVVGAVGSTPATDQDAADQFDATVAPLYKPLMPLTGEYRGVTVGILRAIVPYPAKYIPASANANAGAGTAAGAPLPGQVSGLISYFSPRPGPAGRGRSYVGFPAIVHDTGAGNPTAAYMTLLDNLAAVTAVGIAVVTLGGATATLVRAIIHQTNKFDITPPPDPVTGFVSRGKWATQRRRGDFGRLNSPPV